MANKSVVYGGDVLSIANHQAREVLGKVVKLRFAEVRFHFRQKIFNNTWITSNWQHIYQLGTINFDLSCQVANVTLVEQRWKSFHASMEAETIEPVYILT